MLIVAAAFFGIVAVWYFALWSPQSASMHKSEASAAASQAKESALKAQVVLLQRQRTQLPALRAQLAQLTQSVPADAGIDKVIDDVNAVALASGVTLASFTPPISVAGAAPKVVQGSGAIPMTMGVSLSGTYFELIDFINKLGTMPRLALVDSFSFGSPDKSGKITTSISARVFVSPASAVVPAAATITTTTSAH